MHLWPKRFLLTLGCGLVLLSPSAPASAQSTGYVTGFPGRDPAGDDEIGWGPAYRPETSFSQPGTPPTPGDFAGAAYRARTGRGPYDAVQDTRGGARGVGFAPDMEAETAPRRAVRSRGKAVRASMDRRHQARHRSGARHALR
jgi:hypothetical protein